MSLDLDYSDLSNLSLKINYNVLKLNLNTKSEVQHAYDLVLAQIDFTNQSGLIVPSIPNTNFKSLNEYFSNSEHKPVFDVFSFDNDNFLFPLYLSKKFDLPTSDNFSAFIYVSKIFQNLLEPVAGLVTANNKNSGKIDLVPLDLFLKKQ